MPQVNSWLLYSYTSICGFLNWLDRWSCLVVNLTWLHLNSLIRNFFVEKLSHKSLIRYHLSVLGINLAEEREKKVLKSAFFINSKYVYFIWQKSCIIDTWQRNNKIHHLKWKTIIALTFMFQIYLQSKRKIWDNFPFFHTVKNVYVWKYDFYYWQITFYSVLMFVSYDSRYRILTLQLFAFLVNFFIYKLNLLIWLNEVILNHSAVGIIKS